jgi:hypothetical protein
MFHLWIIQFHLQRSRAVQHLKMFSFFAGSSYSYSERGGTGGQLGHGNEFDYWGPTAVEVLQVNDQEQVAQQDAAGSIHAWTVVQVACGFNHTAAVIELDTDVNTC